MGKWIVRVLGLLLVLGVVAVAFVWLLLAAPFFSDLRRDLVSKVLSEQIDQPLEVNDDVRIALGPITHIYVGGVVIPSQTMDDTPLAELDLLELELDLVRLLNGELHFDNLVLDGLQANLITLENGSKSWREGPAETAPEAAENTQDTSEEAAVEAEATEEPSERNGIVSFLRDKNVSFSAIGLVIDDRLTGFSFDFDLKTLALEQVDDGQRTTVSGDGTVNGQPFEIKGDYPHERPFTTHANFGGMTIDFNGEPYAEADGGGFNGTLDVDTGSFGDFLDILGLERVVEGNGQLTAEIDARDALAVETFTTLIQLDEGRKVTAEGTIADLGKAKGFDVTLEARLYPEGQAPSAAKTFGELKFTGLDMHLVGSLEAFEFETLLFRTNAFDQGLDIIGPASIESIHRTAEGKLAMTGIELLAGPSEDPVLDAKGEILDLLQLQDVSFEGALKGPAKLLFADLEDEFVEQFGGIDAEFAVSNVGGPLSLNRFIVQSYGTDLWSLDLNLALKELKGLGGLDFDVELDVADGAKFLSALNLDLVAIGALGVDATTSREGEEFKASVGFAAGKSNVMATLDTSFADSATTVRGAITSDRLDLNDLQNLAASLRQLQSLVDPKATTSEPEVQPLVLPKEEDDPDVQPLVLPKEEGKPSDLLDVEKLLTEADVAVTIDFKEITGQKGVSSISSELTAKEGVVNFGPLDMAYGGGQFTLSASMDVIDAPETLAVSGATGGWDFGEILTAAGVGIDANGLLSGDFSVSGNISSGKAFINSMRGNANVSMSKGAISTSLLELAGLGIFPWLFSEELRQGYTDITCVVAPVRIESGKASFDAVVVETGSVQLVVAGMVDWINDAISVRAEPRRVGKPLARSAWPFDVTGQLSAPDFKLDVGGSRSRRADGADEMPANRQPCVPDILQLQ